EPGLLAGNMECKPQKAADENQESDRRRDPNVPGRATAQQDLMALAAAAVPGLVWLVFDHHDRTLNIAKFGVRTAAAYLLDVSQGMHNNLPRGQSRDAGDQPHLSGDNDIAHEPQGKAA